MSYAEDFEDIGGWYANQDYYAEACEEYDGNCRKCDCKYECDKSQYRGKIRKEKSNSVRRRSNAFI